MLDGCELETMIQRYHISPGRVLVTEVGAAMSARQGLTPIGEKGNIKGEHRRPER